MASCMLSGPLPAVCRANLRFRQTHYTFTVYPSEAYLAFILAKFTEFCSSFAHIQGLAGLHTVMPIPPRAIKKSGKSNPLGLDRARSGKSLSGEWIRAITTRPY